MQRTDWSRTNHPRTLPGCMPICIGSKGDLGNAGYWYRQAGKPVAAGSLDAEWEGIASVLLGSAEA